jgi:mannose-6-phosphate isomerase-like protein (cupin superfamily)
MTMRTQIMIVGMALLVCSGGRSAATPEVRDARAILESYVEDFKQDPAAAQPITFGIRITGEGGGEWHVVDSGRTLDGSKGVDVALRTGLPEEPCAFYTMDLPTLRKIDQGTWNALTAMGRSRATDPAPMDIGVTEGFTPDAAFFETFVPLSFHFWTRGLPERVPYGSGMTRVLHGANATIFYYQKGLRTAWFQIEKGQHANPDPKEQVTPFPTMVIGLRGRCEGKIGGKTITLGRQEMVFVPAGVSHEFWNPYEEPAEAVLLMFGEGA